MALFELVSLIVLIILFSMTILVNRQIKSRTQWPYGIWEKRYVIWAARRKVSDISDVVSAKRVIATAVWIFIAVVAISESVFFVSFGLFLLQSKTAASEMRARLALVGAFLVFGALIVVLGKQIMKFAEQQFDMFAEVAKQRFAQDVKHPRHDEREQ